MQTQAYNQIIDIPHRCSRILCGLYGTVILLLVLALCLMPLSFPARAVVLALGLISVADMGRRLRVLFAIERIVIRHGRVELMMGKVRVCCHLIGSAVVTPYIVACSLRNQQTLSKWSLPIHLVLLPDSVSSEHHRQLRVFFNTGKIH
ncbi:protein YgfX [Agarilytica rhodophyticola]|uniref:protein YgfX n=1 Tax=Agarilytica rhodophyticola TaxID=1737490 RepID=UPI00318383B5